jgi:hypothetical protein
MRGATDCRSDSQPPKQWMDLSIDIQNVKWETAVEWETQLEG